MPWSLAGTPAHTNGTTAINTLTVPATTIGNLLVIAASSDDTVGSPLAPTGGATWARIGSKQTDGGGQSATWFWGTCTSSVTSITLTGGAGLAHTGVVFAEFTPPVGTISLDTSDTTRAFANYTSTANAETSNNITPAAANELLVAAYYHQNIDQPTITAGTGWTLAVAEPGSTANQAGGAALEYKSSSTGAQGATYTQSITGPTADYTVQIAAFNPADSGGGGPVPNLYVVRSNLNW